MEKKKKKKKKKGKKDKKPKDGPKPKHGVVVMFSGCEDAQVSADVVLEGTATGAVSFALITSMAQHNLDITYADLLASIKKILSERVRNVQYPVLSSNVDQFDFSQKFTI